MCVYVCVHNTFQMNREQVRKHETRIWLIRRSDARNPIARVLHNFSQCQRVLHHMHETRMPQSPWTWEINIIQIEPIQNLLAAGNTACWWVCECVLVSINNDYTLWSNNMCCGLHIWRIVCAYYWGRSSVHPSRSALPSITRTCWGTVQSSRYPRSPEWFCPCTWRTRRRTFGLRSRHRTFSCTGRSCECKRPEIRALPSRLCGTPNLCVCMDGNNNML